MASVNGIWGNGYVDNTSYLFGSTASKTSGTSGNILGIDLAEYSSITRGSYSKLIKAYYEKYGTSKSASEDSSSEKDSTATKTTLKSNADALYKAADALVTTGKDSVFNKVDIKDEETGETTKGYDTEKIYKAVNSLVESYNNFVKKSADSTDNAVLRQSVGMINASSSNGSLLNSIGITINADNTMSVDEEKFKGADMSTVKSLFNGNGSYGSKIQSVASNVYLNVNNSMGNSNSYTSLGTLGNYSTGSILDSFL
ncbi:MAG: flagellar filament capping protein FliD [Lachnospiraceae bacterium]